MPRYGKRMTAVLTILAVAAVATVATAAWVANGAGSGYAEAGTAVDLTTGTATPTATLYPGATGSVSVSFTNPNPYPVKITAVSLDTDGSITSDKGEACLGTNITFNNRTGLEITVGANSSTSQALAGAVTMIGDAADGCQGAKFTIPVTFTGESAA